MNQKIQEFKEWLSKPFGQTILQEEKNHLKPFWKRVLGTSIVLLGNLGQKDLLTDCPSTHKILISPNREKSKTLKVIHAEFELLPIEPDTVDTILLPHALELAQDPYQVLRAMEVALRPDGHVIIIGFNPISLIGLKKIITFNSGAPWSGTKFRCAWRVKDWLHLLNFEVIKQRRFFYRIPMTSGELYNRFHFLDKIGRLIFPFFSGVYIIMAKKNIFSMTPVKSKWHRLPTVVNGSIQPVRNEVRSE